MVFSSEFDIIDILPRWGEPRRPNRSPHYQVVLGIIVFLILAVSLIVIVLLIVAVLLIVISIYSLYLNGISLGGQKARVAMAVLASTYVTTTSPHLDNLHRDGDGPDHCCSLG